MLISEYVIDYSWEKELQHAIEDVEHCDKELLKAKLRYNIVIEKILERRRNKEEMESGN
jgi:NRPS condensation-like uncharacterized protein